MKRIALMIVIGVASVVRGGDWPQLGHDAGRSGATGDEVRPPFSRKWYRLFADEGIQSGVQPVVARGRLFIGTLRGVLHAIDAETGRDLWTYKAGGPILHTCYAGHARVMFTCADGKVYCLRADDGGPQWTFATGQAIWNAPAHDGEDVLVGGRDGKLYALKPATGGLTWSAPVGAPILGSPSVDEQRSRVFVAAEDMRVYAFDRASGRQLWRSPKLPGCSFRGYHPVVAPDGSVMVTVTPVAGGDAIQAVLLDMVKEVFGSFSSWRIKSEEEKKQIRAENFELMKKPETYQKQLDYLRKRLTDEPALQMFFVLDSETGRQKFVAPIVYAESMNGPGSPPVVTPDGKVIVKYNALLRSRYEHYSPFLNVGYLDTASGHVTPIMDQSRTYGWHDSLLLVHDEQSQLVVGGGVLVNTHQDNVNAMDLKTLKGYAAPWANGVHEVGPGVSSALWAYVLHGKELPQGWEWLARGTAVYGGGSVIDVPVVIAGDSFYFLPTHEINAGVALIAYRMDPQGKSEQKIKAEELTKEKLGEQDWAKITEMKWDWDTLGMPRLNHALSGLPGKMAGTRESPKWEEAKGAVGRIGDGELDRLILEAARWERVSGDAPQAGPLNSAVGELISKQWRPLLFPAGKHPAEAYRWFVDPSETLYTLALAYPNLSPEMRTKVKDYVNGPLAGALGKRTFDLKAGEVRSAYDEPPEHLLKVAVDPVRSETARIYPRWLWAHVSGESERLKTDWPRLRDGIDPKAEKDESDLGNGRISGLMAACRIAKQVGDRASLDRLLPLTRSAIRERLQYELAHTEGGLMTRQNLRTLMGRWRNLNPDLARVLRTYAGPIHRRLMDVYVDHHRPAWYVAWNVELLWRNECPFSFPDMSRDIFAARAMILGEDDQRLARFVDIPWCRGDEYYAQKLAMAVSSRER
jgi:PQQ-like domain/PQQ enzyme repeat